MSMMADIQGKVALITGAGSGIGEATARLLAAQGAKVALVERDPQKLETITAELSAQGCQALALSADVRSVQHLDQAVERLVARWGRLDVVFANAGVNGVWAPIDELTPQEWMQTIETNLTGCFLTIRACVPQMKKNGGGSIIITSSVNGTRMFSNTGATAYACSKAGQVALAKMLALELAQHQIRVNVICPGWVESHIGDTHERRCLEGLTPRGKFPDGAVPLTGGAAGKAEQVASVVLFLASELANHVTGTEIWVDGGQSLLQG